MAQVGGAKAPQLIQYRLANDVFILISRYIKSRNPVVLD